MSYLGTGIKREICCRAGFLFTETYFDLEAILFQTSMRTLSHEPMGCLWRENVVIQKLRKISFIATV